jgi:squalene-hopene/tetraprenyl-beta-curcumene cyclase
MKDQTEDGPWFGRWGANYVYGTSGVLRALETVALTAQEYCQRAVKWLHAVQNPDGGFGESIESYYNPALKGRGVSTPSQTAWGLIGLLAAGEADNPAVTSAVTHLVEQQQSDGSWAENEFTGTGFPSVFYLKYHLYRNYFPLYALARYRNITSRKTQFCALQVRPQEFEPQRAD